jgi:hypothetical protein
VNNELLGLGEILAGTQLVEQAWNTARTTEAWPSR